jgi:hypothetical protein
LFFPHYKKKTGDEERKENSAFMLNKRCRLIMFVNDLIKEKETDKLLSVAVRDHMVKSCQLICHKNITEKEIIMKGEKKKIVT